MADDAIASPLDLLWEEERAREVLLLTFSLNLEFWERYALSVARGLGARVTVVGDAAMVAGDPAHVRYAGVTYLDGRAACRKGGAFHPKLLVIAGEHHAVVAIGSGNATLAGWHDNAELWTVLRGDSGGAPDTFVSLADWLRRLPEHVLLSSGVPEVLARVAESLERLPTHEPGPQLISSLNGPIMDELPKDSADELTLSAPFYDRQGIGVRALLDRFRPSSFRVLVQPKDVVADGHALSELVRSEGGSAEAIASDRYYHGKLIEWTSRDRTFALTGSPNLSKSALLKGLSDGGNCELALYGEIEASLAPPSAGAIASEELLAITFSPRGEPVPGITLLGVLLGPDRLELTLGRPLAEDGVMEYLVGAEWDQVAPLPRGVLTHEIRSVLAAGTAVRVRQGALTSNVCFVGDPARFSRTRIEHLGRVRTDQEEVFRDPRVAEDFAHDLAELRQFLTPVPRGPAPGGAAHGQQRTSTFTSWEEYLDACEALVGERLLAYGLALPALESGDGRREDADDGALEDDSVDLAPTEAAQEDFEDSSPVLAQLPETQRRRYRRWCERLVDLSPELPYAGRLIALRLVLDAVRGELFVAREDWFPLVARATVALGPPGAVFEEERAPAGSLAAVALAVMRGQLRRFAAWEEMRIPYERAIEATKTVLEDARLDLCERYASSLVDMFGASVSSSVMEALIESVVSPDPIEDALKLAAEEYNLPLEREGQLLRVLDGSHGDPRRTLLRVVGLVEGIGVAVMIGDLSDYGSLAVWRSPDLILVQSTQGGMRGARYELRGWGPSSYADDPGGLPRPREEWLNSAALAATRRELATLGLASVLD